jgi:hypothetical protein
MKRVILEWGVMLWVGMALTLSTLWVASTFFDRTSYHLRFATSGSLADDIHVVVRDGDLSLCNQFDMDASGNVRPLMDTLQLTASDIRRGGYRPGRFMIPGVDGRYCRLGSGGYLIWSLRLSLLIPVVLLFLLAIVFRRRLKHLRRAIEQDPVGNIDRRSQPVQRF